MHGRCSASARPVYGRYLAGTRPVLCCCLASEMLRTRRSAGAWPLLCQSTAGTRPQPGRRMVGLLCRYLAASLPMHSRCSANARPLPGRYLASAVRCYPASAMPPPDEAALPLPGHFSASARPLPRQCQAATRQLPGKRLGRCSGNTRPLHGRYFDWHLSRHQAGALLIRRQNIF